MDDRTIRTVPGYGASLRQQLETIGWTQGRLASESSASRQTISRAINRDEVSDRTRARLDAALRRAPARRHSNRRPGAGSEAGVPGGALCDGTDLVAWASRRESQSLLPLLIRRLIRATATPETEFRIRTGDGVHLPGWDGIVQADEGSRYVPADASGWEMSVAMRPKTAADTNWTKRTRDPAPLTPEDSAFVFVTPRRWPDKDKWVGEKIRQGPWRDVRVYDADDLAAWLEEAPAIHTWLSIEIGKIPPGTNDLESYWNRWSGETRPALTPAVLLSSRDKPVAEMHRRLSDLSGQTLVVQAESREEAVAWMYCVIRDLPSRTADSILARCLVVESPEALRQLTSARAPLVLVPRFDPEELAPAAARAGHAVIIPMDEAGSVQEENVIRVPPVSRRSVTDALKECGFDDDRASEMAALAVRSLTAFRRSVALSPAFRQPGWSKPGVARGLIPAVLAGSWNDANPRDRELLSSLGTRPYEEVAGTILKWSVGGDPLVRRKQHLWYLVSPEDAWRLLGRYLLSPDLERFLDAALAVLGGVDPAFDLPPDQRWMAAALDRVPEHSGLLRKGLVTTLVVMAVHGAEEQSEPISARETSERIIRRVLAAANADWRLWGSLSGHLPAFAEAAPDRFLDAVEDGLREPEPALRKLLDPDGDPTLGPHLHTGLVRALEVLAWSPDYLGRVVSLLAKLDLLDPESELRPREGNERGRVFPRPLSSLTAVFRSWLPETSATLTERLAVLDALRRSHGSAAWYVMISMLPEMHAVGHPNSRPSVRDWALDARKGIDRRERARTVAETVVRLLKDSGFSGRRWVEVLKHVDMLPPAEHDLVVGGLEVLESGALGEDDRNAIWAGLRSIVAHHRAYSRAKWAMPEEYLARLDRIRERFAPSDPVERYRGRFGQNWEPVDGGDVEDTPWEAQEEKWEDARVEAVEAVILDAGLDGLRALARAAEDPYLVGRSAGKAPLSPADADELLSRNLCDSDQALGSMAFGYAVGRVRERGPEWAVQQLHRGELRMTVNQRVKILLALPADPHAWQASGQLGDEVSLAYWREIPIRYFNAEHLSEAVAGLLVAGRPYAAADLAAFEGQGDRETVTGELAAEVLEQAVGTPTEHDSPSSRFGSSAGFLLDVMARSACDEGRLARLEWALMPALRWHRRNPAALHQLLAEDPGFFVEMLSLVYRAEGTKPEEVDDEALHRASAAYSVLSSWRTVPGQDGDGRIDGPRLQGWLDDTELRLRQAERVAIGHQKIGQMLSGSPHDPDGTWPCSPVRDAIEKVASTDLEIGLGTGVMNSRGVVSKNPSEGGASERALAERYEGYAAAVRALHPCTAAALRRIGEWYRRDGSREDFRVAMWEEM